MAFQAFLNECSLHGQFYDPESLLAAVKNFVGLVERMRQAATKGRGQLLRSQHLGEQKTLREMTLTQALNNLRDPDWTEQFAEVVFNRTNPKPWQAEQVHFSQVDYICTDKELPLTFDRAVVGTSMAELAERQRQDDTLQGILLNLESSGLGGRSDVTVTVQNSAVRLLCYDAPNALERWIGQQQPVPVYTTNCTVPPLDAQTCLVDTLRFEPTAMMNRWRRVFRERTSDRLFAVDNLHFGRGAELEVFDKRKKHIGTADIHQGKLNTAGKVEGRRLQNED